MQLRYFFILIVLLFGCSSGDSKTEGLKKIETEFKKALAEISPTANKTSPVYLVIPRAGCSGCISDAELYMTNFISKSPKSTKITFILTSFDDEKILKARFDTLLRKPQLVIDYEDKIGANGLLKSIYPSVYIFNKDGSLKEINAFSPSTDGQNSIENYLKN